MLLPASSRLTSKVLEPRVSEICPFALPLFLSHSCTHSRLSMVTAVVAHSQLEWPPQQQQQQGLLDGVEGHARNHRSALPRSSLPKKMTQTITT
jgi:hypothetical protein